MIKCFFEGSFISRLKASALNIPYLLVIRIINNTDAVCTIPHFSIYTEIVIYKYFSHPSELRKRLLSEKDTKNSRAV